MNPSYNGFRAFAFLGVFLFHTADGGNAGYLGVQAFFVLSGFLITPILLQTKANFQDLEPTIRISSYEEPSGFFPFTTPTYSFCS